VRRATEQFLDVRNAGPDYQQILGCVSGPQEGAMGVHFLNGALAFDATLDADKPEALICEFKCGVACLVGVEYLGGSIESISNSPFHYRLPESETYDGSPPEYHSVLDQHRRRDSV
jgi:hypothetical protein